MKASLICPEESGSSGSDDINRNHFSSKQLKILTAHGERLGTMHSSLHISMSIAAADYVLNPNAKKDELKHSHSIQFTARASTSTAANRHKKNNDESCPEHEHATDENSAVRTIRTVEKSNMSHRATIQTIIREIKQMKPGLIDSVVAVGHRVVHGGGKFFKATLINKEILKEIENISHLAPLHNPSNLEGIRIAMEVFNKNVLNVAVFDTAFHSTIPRYAYEYPIPKEYVQHQIRRYGFHGTSVQYVSQCAINALKSMNKNHDRLIVAHLGNGASVTAVVEGKSVDTSMEFTPLSGIMMGTRSGSIDPSIIIYASNQLGIPPEKVLNDLNRRSGLYGVSGGFNDMRVVIERANGGDTNAQLAIEMFVYVLAKNIAALIVPCGGSIDAIIFTAGVGEHSPLIRKLTLDRISHMLGGIVIDSSRNEVNGKDSHGIISVDKCNSTVAMVLRTDEEAMICRECETFVNAN